MNRSEWLRSRLSAQYLRGSTPVATWLRGTGWILGSSLLERGSALIQTILIARAIGIADYGRYALLFTTLGMVSPLIALYLPQTIITLVSRFSEREPERAGAMLLLADRFSWALALGMLCLCILWPETLSQWLLQDSRFSWAIIGGGVIMLTATLAGLSDALLQAKQQLRSVAIARTLSAIAGLILLILMVLYAPTLNNVVAAVAVTSVLRLIAVAIPARPYRKAMHSLTSLRSAWQHAPFLLSFSLLNLTYSVMITAATWFSQYMLSRSPAGFNDLAIVNTGVQWRLPVLMVLSAMTTAALPMLSAMVGKGQEQNSGLLQRYNMILNLGLALVFTAMVIAASDVILGLYNPSFRAHSFLFAIIVLALIPMVYCNVHQQMLTARGHMWTQIGIFVPNVAIVVAGTIWLGAGMDGIALAYLQLTGWIATAICLFVLKRVPRSVAPHGSE